MALLGSACTYTPLALQTSIPPNAESSVLLAADGSELTVLHSDENRTEITLDQVPRYVIDAVVAIEDRRFWRHSGVDVRGIVRAARRNVAAGEVVEGGSTITQQFVKNALIGSDRTLDRKVQEASLALQVERQFTKEQILEYYLNTVYFGSGAYGIEAASRVYFGKTTAQLDPAEGALLAGLIKAPSTYDPFVNPEGAVKRRSLVLRAMAEEGYLTPEEANALDTTDIRLVPPDPDTRYRAPYFVEAVKRFILSDPAFGASREERARLLFTGGLTIETTLDPVAQSEAEKAVGLVLSRPDTDPDAAVVSMDPDNGHVIALVGGRDFFDGGPRSKFDLATQGRRPAGSSFKPLVLAAALEEGVTLDREYDAPSELSIDITGGVWDVENYGGAAGGRVNLVEATVNSYNTAYAQLIVDVGPADAMAVAARMGVDSPLQPVLSSVLGANDVSPLDMATAYATLAARGVRHDPVFVTRVLDAEGRVIYEAPDTAHRAVERSTADQVTSVLQQVMSRGTGIKARIGRPAAGKTGTGQNWGDAWFVGYTPDLVTAVWVGFAEGQIPMVPPTTRVRVTGGTWPAQIWQLYMGAVLATAPATDFAPPDTTPSDQARGSADEEEAVARTDGGPTGQLVTDVVGMPTNLAEEILTRDGFVVVTESVPDDELPPGFVASQSPPGESIVPGGGEIVLRIANGERVRRVPGVLGLDPGSAAEALVAAGYGVDVVERADDDPDSAAALSGLVWKVEPAGGSPLAAGETVSIWVNP